MDEAMTGLLEGVEAARTPADLALSAVSIESTAEFDALAPEWQALWARCPEATPFQHPAWLLSWWRHFSPGDLFSVTVRHAGRLVGLAPLYIETGPYGRRILPVGISLSDYLDVLLDPDFSQAAGRAIVEHLQREAARWDGWDLEDLAPGAAALGLPCPAGCAEATGEQHACPVLQLPATLDAFSASLSDRKLRSLRLARNRAARRGTVALTREDGSTAGDFLETLFRLHQAWWESRGEPGLLVDGRVPRFHREVVPKLLDTGMLRFYMLRIADHAAGAYYGFRHGGRAYAYFTGFNPDFVFEGPGTILLAHAIEEAIREGAREFHFLRGREAYKYTWGPVDRWNRRRSFRQAGAADAGV